MKLPKHAITDPRNRHPRKGSVAVLATIFSVVMLGMVALSVDIGYMLSMREEMQRSADAAALAACWEYSHNTILGNDSSECEQAAREAAEAYAASNEIGNVRPLLDTNLSNSAEGDLVFGYIEDLYNPDSIFNNTSQNPFNAVRVRVRRDAEMNGIAPSFFGRIFGHEGHALSAQATAAMVRDVQGFTTSNDGCNIALLPFALDLETCQYLIDNSGDDAWTWDAETGRVIPGPDGLVEVNLFPQGTGSPGNRGTVDIGSANNSTQDIARQVLYGIGPDELAYHGGTLELDENGELLLNGDTGISAGVSDELKQILGQPRAIPIFSVVHSPGNNAVYTIVKWMGIRIMDVQLNGPMNKKHVTIQVAPLVCGGGVIPSTTVGTSAYVFSRAALIE